MRVIGSGFGRTGTLSLKRALEELGFAPCYHMEEVIRRPAHVRAWQDHADGRAVDWPRLFAGFDAAVDFPASIVYRELMETFPEAKVVHTVRDSARWYDSTYETIYQAQSLFPRWARTVVPPVGRFARMTESVIWDGLFDGRFEDRDAAIARYESWTAEVIDTVPADRLLVFEVAQGWEPLCEFLGVLQPGGPFPHVNDREVMLRRFARVRRVGRAAPVAAGVAATAVGASVLRRRRRVG